MEFTIVAYCLRQAEHQGPPTSCFLWSKFSFFFKWEAIYVKTIKENLTLPSFMPSEQSVMINMIVLREGKVVNVLLICHSIEILWHL